MQRFDTGDRVRIDIPDKSDPDHDRYHGVRGTVWGISEDDAGRATGDERDSILYEVGLDNGESVDFRWRALRPIGES